MARDDEARLKRRGDIITTLRQARSARRRKRARGAVHVLGTESSCGCIRGRRRCNYVLTLLRMSRVNPGPPDLSMAGKKEKVTSRTTLSENLV